MEMAKSCLVLDAHKLEKLSIDGPALKIRLLHQSDRLFPFRRLARVHIVGTLNNPIEPLIELAEQHIPVAFFTLKGKLRCQLYYPVFANSIISHWLEHVEFCPQAKHEYAEWLLHQNLHFLASMGYRNGNLETRLQSVEEHLNKGCKKIISSAQYELALDWLSGIMAVHMSQVIAAQGVAHQSRATRKLMDDLSPICILWIKAILFQKLQTGKITITAQTMSYLYQEQATFIEYTLQRMMVQLITRLESII